MPPAPWPATARSRPRPAPCCAAIATAPAPASADAPEIHHRPAALLPDAPAINPPVFAGCAPPQPPCASRANPPVPFAPGRSTRPAPARASRPTPPPCASRFGLRQRSADRPAQNRGCYPPPAAPAHDQGAPSAPPRRIIPPCPTPPAARRWAGFAADIRRAHERKPAEKRLPHLPPPPGMPPRGAPGPGVAPRLLPR